MNRQFAFAIKPARQFTLAIFLLAASLRCAAATPTLSIDPIVSWKLDELQIPTANIVDDGNGNIHPVMKEIKPATGTVILNMWFQLSNAGDSFELTPTDLRFSSSKTAVYPVLALWGMSPLPGVLAMPLVNSISVKSKALVMLSVQIPERMLTSVELQIRDQKFGRVAALKQADGNEPNFLKFSKMMGFPGTPFMFRSGPSDRAKPPTDASITPARPQRLVCADNIEAKKAEYAERMARRQFQAAADGMRICADQLEDPFLQEMVTEAKQKAEESKK